MAQRRKLQEKVSRLWSRNLAYAIELITSDGCLNSDKRHISIVSADAEMINNFKVALGIINKVTRHYRSNEKEKRYYTVTFGDIAFYEFLNGLGVTAAKSRTIKSVDVPEIYFSDFVRGVFDGDGSFYTFWDKRWPSSFGFKTSFASASKDFIQWLQARLTAYYGVKGYLHKGAGVINLEYVKSDSLKLFNVMYGGLEGSLFLRRKYLKMKAALEFDKSLKAAVAQW